MSVYIASLSKATVRQFSDYGFGCTTFGGINGHVAVPNRN